MARKLGTGTVPDEAMILGEDSSLDRLVDPNEFLADVSESPPDHPIPPPRKKINLESAKKDLEATLHKAADLDLSACGTVMVAAPVRNRGYILDSYLKALFSLDFPEDRIGFYFVLNDSVDHTRDVLVRYRDKVREGKHKSAFFDFDEVNPGAPLDYRIKGVRFGSDGRKGIIAYLAMYRNKILKRFRNSGMDFLLSVDSDTIVSPGLLRTLIAVDRPVVSAFVDVDSGSGRIGNMMRWEFDPKRGRQRLKHIPRAEDGLYSVDSTGGVVLVRKDVAAAIGVRYFVYPPGVDAAGEDAGFVRSAQAAGFESWCLVTTPPLAIHRMAKMQDEVFYREIGVLGREGDQ